MFEQSPTSFRWLYNLVMDYLVVNVVLVVDMVLPWILVQFLVSTLTLPVVSSFTSVLFTWVLIFVMTVCLSCTFVLEQSLSDLALVVIQESSSEVRLGYDVCSKRIKKSKLTKQINKGCKIAIGAESMCTFIKGCLVCRKVREGRREDFLICIIKSVGISRRQQASVGAIQESRKSCWS